MHSEHGFSLTELLIALLLTLLLGSAVLTMVHQAQAASQAQPEAIDMQQRARVAADVLLHDLITAGAGPVAGTRPGALLNSAPPIMPRRVGLMNADDPTVARVDTISVMSVPVGAVQTTVRSLFAGPGADLVVDQLPGCVAGAPVCGLSVGMSTVLFDALGRFDLFDVTAVGPGGVRMQLLGRTGNGSYQPGDAVAEVAFHTYYLDPVSRQLRHYDGNVTDVPVVDNVVSLTFAYFGEPRPPDRPKPPPGTENCLYDTDGLRKPLPELTPAGGSLAPLPLAMLSDGPWCGSGSYQFDADLLRVRVVRVSLRVEATPAAFRANGPAFAQAGSSRSANRWLADYVMTFDVAPRNLNLAREP